MSHKTKPNQTNSTAWSETQTVLSRVWTQVTDSISYDNNRYTTSNSTPIQTRVANVDFQDRLELWCQSTSEKEHTLFQILIMVSVQEPVKASFVNNRNVSLEGSLSCRLKCNHKILQCDVITESTNHKNRKKQIIYISPHPTGCTCVGVCFDILLI